ncbi:MAG: hypothetical protein Q4C61_17875 [Lachnospiraceae bacterium]|nr:hypothetical protein [Lachnospiraceae bacterium]
MKADNVEQLMEIVRAVQNGQEPEEVLRRKEAESAPLADSPKSRPETGASEKDFLDEEGFDDDEFEKNLEADGEKEISLKPVRNAVGSGAKKVSGFFKNLGRKSEKKENRSEMPEEEEKERAGLWKSEEKANHTEPRKSEEETNRTEFRKSEEDDAAGNAVTESAVTEKSPDELAFDRLLDRDDLNPPPGEEEEEKPEKKGKKEKRKK